MLQKCSHYDNGIKKDERRAYVCMTENMILQAIYVIGSEKTTLMAQNLKMYIFT